ncbi:potassium transporter Trk [Paenibacillus sp. HMSSN-139]|nr:potassium transporter Trk [Paenibacillus sp. HMSSN-139]
MKTQQFVVIGLGRFGSSLALELMDLGYEVLGIDRNEELVEEMSDQLTHAVVADATDEEVLKSLGVRNFDCGIVAIGNDIQMSILAAILLKDLGIKTVVAKAISVLHGRALEKLGVDRVIYPERDMGIRVAHQLVTPNLLDYIELSKEYSIVEMNVPACLNQKSLGDLNPRPGSAAASWRSTATEAFWWHQPRWISSTRATSWSSSARKRISSNLRRS